jgi:hypothetical protein
MLTEILTRLRVAWHVLQGKPVQFRIHHIGGSTRPRFQFGAGLCIECVFEAESGRPATSDDHGGGLFNFSRIVPGKRLTRDGLMGGVVRDDGSVTFWTVSKTSRPVPPADDNYITGERQPDGSMAFKVSGRS